jgi:hypothetical protein
MAPIVREVHGGRQELQIHTRCVLSCAFDVIPRRDPFGSHDEALRGRTDVVEGPAADQGEHRDWRRVEHPQSVWLDDQGFSNQVVKVAMRGLESQDVSETNPLQRSEQRVSMGGQGAVAGVPGERRVWQVPDGSIQDRILVTFDHDA